MNDHLSPTALAAYVQGELDEATVRVMEAHASGCDACRERLAREARFELSLETVAREPPIRRGRKDGGHDRRRGGAPGGTQSKFFALTISLLPPGRS